MNKNKLKQFVNALDELSDDVKNMDVRMISTSEPTCGTPGCHAGLISIVAKEFPEMKDTYKRLLILKLGIKCNNFTLYSFQIWADTLTDFLGFKDRFGLMDWAVDNPKLWGNNRGDDMFCSRLAFTNDEYKQLTHIDIINHWKQVLKKVEA
ncbi:hypothetical protein [uncultured Gammaproteobacteria bacterium]|nr:hypothetical protein [uncultured Gammaproteobacteria bacterium]